MRPEDRDPGYVWDMVDAARTIQDFTAGALAAKANGMKGGRPRKRLSV